MASRLALQFNRHEILHQSSPARVQAKAHDYALELAILGAADQARTLLSLIYQFAHVTHASTAMNNGLCYAWSLSGAPPKDIEKSSAKDEEQSKTANGIMKQYVKDTTSIYERSCWGEVKLQDRKFDKRGLEACMSALGTVDPDLDASPGWPSTARSEMLVIALDISLKLSPSWLQVDKVEGSTAKIQTSEKLDDQSSELLSRMIQRWNKHKQFQHLGMAKRLWPLFLGGAVADAMNISLAQVETIGQELIDIFRERLDNEAKPSPTSTRGILELLELNTLCGAGNSYYLDGGYERRPETYFKNGASQPEIIELERRLDIELPEDYKDFLRTTNGFGVDIDGIFNGLFPEPALWPVEKVGWSFEEYFQLPVDLIDLPPEYRELAPRKKRKTKPEGQLSWDEAVPIFDKVLEIGTRDIYNLWLVHPALVSETVNAYNHMYQNASKKQKEHLLECIEELAGSKDEFDSWSKGQHWCCVSWASGGSASMEAYASFGDYLRKMVDRSAEIL